MFDELYLVQAFQGMNAAPCHSGSFAAWRRAAEAERDTNLVPCTTTAAPYTNNFPILYIAGRFGFLPRDYQVALPSLA